MGKVALFAADDGVHGEELWITDGTEAGTRMVKDILPPEANPFEDPSFDGSDPRYLTDLGGGRILFQARDELFRRDELWVSDGTAEGTALLVDINTEDSLTPRYITPVGNGLFVFSGYGSDAEGHELWVTDGTAAGTRALADIMDNAEYPYSSYPGNFHQLAPGRVVFTADNGSDGTELWVTNGTQAGTMMLRDFNPGSDSSFVSALSYHPLSGGRLMFTAYNGTVNDTWVIDGTAGGTVKLGGPEWGSVERELPGGRYLISRQDEDDRRIFAVTDGTAEGTVNIGHPPGVTEPAPDPFYFELGVDEGLFPVPDDNPHYTPPSQLLGDGRLLFSAETVEIKPMTGSDQQVYEVRWHYGKQLWVTDGSEGGTTLVEKFNTGDPFPDPDTLPPGVIILPPSDVEDFYPDSRPDDFLILNDGRALFVAQVDESTSNLYISDGTSGGTRLLVSDVTAIDDALPWTDEVLFFTLEGSERGLWRTDGSVAGTKRLIEEGENRFFSSFTDAYQIDNGEWLFETRDSNGSAVYRLNAEADMATHVMDGSMPFTLQSRSDDNPLYSLGGGKYLTSQEDVGDGYWEPYLFDVDAGTLTLIKDINPGGAGMMGTPVVIIPADQIPIPVSTLFPVRISLEEEASSFDLDDYFTDPEDSPLTYRVEGLPDDIAVDGLTNVMAAAENVEAGEHEITISARNPAGGEVVSNLTWSILDTGQLKLSTTGEWGRAHATAPFQSTPGSVITVGLKQGTEALFRIEELDPTKPVAKIDGTKVTLEGKLFSTQVNTSKPLMEGSFTLDMASLAVTNFADANSNSDFRLLDNLIDFTFADISLRSDSIAFRTDLAFDDGGGTGPSYNALSTTNAPLGIVFGANGIAFEASQGTERWSPDPIEFDFGGGSTMSVGFSNLGIDYEAGTQDIYINGKATVEWGGALENGFTFIGDDSQKNLTIDLFGTAQQNNLFKRGDKYLKISTGSSGWDWDVVGEIKYEDKYPGPVPAKGFLVKELLVTFDTIKNEYTGAFKANIPLLFGLDLSASLGFVKNPDLQLDKISVGLDGLDYPLGTTGLFVQGGTLGLENLAAADPNSGYTYKAEIRGTFGPDNNLIKSPLHGSISGSIKETTEDKKTGYVMTGTVAMDSKVGYFITDTVNLIARPLIDYFGVSASDVTNFELLKANSTTSLNLVKERAQYDASITLLGGVVQGAAQLISAPHGQIKNAQVLSGSISASINIPEDFPLVGGMTRSGNAIFTYSSDGISSNDLAAFWSQITIPLGFTTRVYAFGAELKFDGSYRFLGRKDIPKISSWALEPEDELVILTARWENDAADVAIELITPQGLVLSEADIAALDWVALVDDLNTETGRHVALSAPEAGIWDLRVVDATGLGEVSYEANEMLASASAPIASVTADAEAHQAQVVITADTGGAAEAHVTIFAAPGAGAVAGIVLAEVTVSDGAGPVTETIDFDDLGPGEWHIYTRTDAQGRAPLIQMHPTPIQIEGAADLATSARQASFGPSGTQVMTVEVRNEGNRPSEPGQLTVFVPPSMQGADPVPELGADPLAQAETSFDLPALEPGQSFTIRIALPAGSEDLEDAVQVQAWTPGYDADPTDNSLGQVLYTDAFDLIDQFLEGGSLADILRGQGGSDTLFGQSGDDFLLPGSGSDTVEGGAGASDLLGLDYHSGPLPNQAADVDLAAEIANNDGFGFTDIVRDVEDILGTRFGDRLTGNGFANFIFGAEGDDEIDGAGGSDVIWGGPGQDTVEGGAGHDYLAFPSASSFLFSGDFHTVFPTVPFGTLGVTVDLTAGTATDSFGDVDSVSGFESVIGTPFADDITGTDEDNYLSGDDGADRLIGLGGDDSLDGEAGDDSLSGGDGNDRLTGSAGADSLNGGAGTDEVSYRDALAGVTVNLSLGIASEDGFGSSDILEGIEEITGSDFADLLTGDAGDNTFTGRGGNDTIIGGAGHDDLIYAYVSGGVTVDLTTGTAFGADGSDSFTGIEWVTGSFFADLIIGDGGGNILAGLDGDDTIQGGGETDVLMGGAGDDDLDGGAGGDLAFFFGDQESFTLTLSPSEIVITDRRAGGEGSDRLTSIELLDFERNIELFGADPMPLILFDGPTGLTAEQFSEIIELYIAYFNRAPDALGLYYWATEFSNGFTIPDMAANFFGQPETQATYASVLDDQGQLDVGDAAKVGDFVTAVYNNVLGRGPDTPGFDYWVGELTNNPAITPGVFILAIIGGAKNPGNPTPQTALDQAYLATKSDLGAYFSVIKGMSDVSDAAAAMALFSAADVEGSRDATIAAIDGHYADALDPLTGDFLMPLIGVIDDPFAL